jgi:hypothetical protein
MVSAARRSNELWSIVRGPYGSGLANGPGWDPYGTGGSWLGYGPGGS